MRADPRQQKKRNKETMLEILNRLYANIEALGIHRHGWLFIAAVLVIPAIVSGNMVQFNLTALIRRKADTTSLIRPLIVNLLVLAACVAVIATATYLHLTPRLC